MPEYATIFFANSINSHSAVQNVDVQPSGHVRVLRKAHAPVTIAPVSIEFLRPEHVEQVFNDSPVNIICVVKRDSHYSWAARERAAKLGASAHTMREVWASLGMEDPRLYSDKHVSYQRIRLEQHSKVRGIDMICEASMKIVRSGSLPPVTVAIEYEYEFAEEALVKAIQRHRGVSAILNANPNGRPTRAALEHAKSTGIGLFSLGELMGALNYGGNDFINYKSPEKFRR